MSSFIPLGLRASPCFCQWGDVALKSPNIHSIKSHLTQFSLGNYPVETICSFPKTVPHTHLCHHHMLITDYFRACVGIRETPLFFVKC